MVIGVMSDSHGNRELLHRAVDQLMDQHGAGLLYHLGDNYEEAHELVLGGYPARIIPGLWCREYRDPRVPNTHVDDHEGVRFACAHSEGDWGPAERAADVLMCGHTHVARVVRDGQHILLNPGHLKALPTDRGERPSYAVVRIGPDALDISIHELDGAVRAEQRIPR